MTRDQFIRSFFIVLLVFIVYQTFLIFSPFYQSIFWAAILAFAFFPLYDRIRKGLKSHPTFSSLLTTLVIIFAVLPPLVYIVINLTSQAIQLYQTASDYVREGRLELLIERIRTLQVIQNLQSRTEIWAPLKENAGSWLLRASKEFGNFTALQAGIFTKNIFFISINVFLTMTLVFIFLRDGEKIYQFIYHATPLEDKNKKPIFKQINDTFTAVIRGQLLTAIVQSIVAGIIFWLVGIPLPILFAIVLFFTTLIPVLGAATVWLPLVLYLLGTHQPVRAAILFIFGVLVISLLDNVMKPAIIGEKTKLPYFLLFFGILGGLKIYGFMGIFLAPVVLSLFFALVKIYQEKNW